MSQGKLVNPRKYVTESHLYDFTEDKRELGPLYSLEEHQFNNT